MAPRIHSLAQLRASPLTGDAGLGGVTLRSACAVAHSGINDPRLSPHQCAAVFYVTHQAAASVGQRMPASATLSARDADVLTAYHGVIAEQSVRLARYVLYIVLRELRHGGCQKCLNGMGKGNTLAERDTLRLALTHGDSTVGLLKRYANDPAVDSNKVTVVRAMLLAERAFATVGAWSESYGGKPWATIARTLGQFYAGTISAEVFVDLAYALQHNTASMFNKGKLYHPGGAELARLLDAQRGGQVVPYLRAAREGTEPGLSVDMAEAHVALDALGTLLPPGTLERAPFLDALDAQGIVDAGSVLHVWRSIAKDQGVGSGGALSHPLPWGVAGAAA